MCIFLEEKRMSLSTHLIAAALVAGMSLFSACSREVTPAGGTTGGGGGTQKIVLGIVAKSQTNQVFQAAHQGAKDAARELGSKYGYNIELKIETPVDEDAQKQAQAVRQLASAGAVGIAVSCSEAGTLRDAIDEAVGKNIPVICFDSDSPQSKRFAYYGTDDIACGTRVAAELVKVMGVTGNVSILCGNQAAPNLQARQKAVRDELAKHPGIKIISAVYHAEKSEDAAKAVQQEQTAHPEITGWAMIGGWPLFAEDALKWQPGTVKVVSVDALPPQLKYLESGHVQMLLAQDCYGWGYKSIEMLLEKIKNDKSPANGKEIDPLQAVTKAGGNGAKSAAEFASNWNKWLGK
jgi:ribose transport system substrate-binding protein